MPKQLMQSEKASPINGQKVKLEPIKIHKQWESMGDKL